MSGDRQVAPSFLLSELEESECINSRSGRMYPQVKQPPVRMMDYPLKQARSTRSSRAACCTPHSVMLPAETSGSKNVF